MNEPLRAAVDAFIASGVEQGAHATRGDAGASGRGEGALGVVTAAVPGSVQFVDFLRDLRGSLTHADGLIRRRATQLLAAVIEAAVAGGRAAALCPRPDHARVLTTFFYERLGDFPSVHPSLRALRALLGIIEGDPALFPGAAIAVCKAVFAEVHVQAMEQPSRQAVYELLLYVASSSVHGATMLGRAPGVAGTVGLLSAASDAPYILEFAVGVAAAVDGEKDPRCLLVALKLIATLLTTPAVSGHGFGDAVASYTQELFDVSACYFPITFTPPPNDPHGITREALQHALRDVFAASPRMAGYVMPLLLEKLGSTLTEAKRDALSTLMHCAPLYGPTAMAPHLPALADALREEVVHARRGDGGGGADANAGSLLPSLWTSPRPGVAAGEEDGSTIALTAGAIGLNFSGADDLHVHSGYGLYQPPPLEASSSGSEATLVAPGSGGGGSSPAGAGPAAGAGGTSRPPRAVSDDALVAIAELTHLLSGQVQEAGAVDGWHAFVSPLIRFGMSEVARAAESLVGRASARILCAIGAASHHGLASVLENLMPVIVAVHADATAHHRLAVRVSVVALLAGLLHTINHGVDHPPGGHPFSKHVDAVFDVLMATLVRPLLPDLLAAHGGGGAANAGGAAVASGTSLTAAAMGKADAEARCIAAAGLCDLAVRPPSPLLAVEQKIQIVEAFTAVFLEDDDDVVREACLRALCTMASVRQRFCNAVINIATPRLLAVLRETANGPPPPETTPDVTAASPPGPADVREDGVTLTASQAERFTDMHLPGLPDVTSRALYALGQLCCISNVRVQLTIVPQLLDIAIEVAHDADGSDPPTAAAVGAAAAHPPPAPAPSSGAPLTISLAGGSAGGGSGGRRRASGGGGAAPRHPRGRYRLCCSSGNSTAAAVSMAVMETLGRFVATKARVGDSGAMDVLVLPTPEAAKIHAALVAKSGLGQRGARGGESLFGDGSTFRSTDDASSVNTGQSGADVAAATGFAAGMSTILADGARAGVLLGGTAGDAVGGAGFSPEAPAARESGPDPAGSSAPAAAPTRAAAEPSPPATHPHDVDLVMLVPTLLYVLVDSTRVDGAAATPSARDLFSPVATPGVAALAPPSPAVPLSEGSHTPLSHSSDGEDGVGGDARLAAVAASHALRRGCAQSSGPLPVLSIRVRSAIELILRTVATYASMPVQEALREVVTRLLLGVPPVARVQLPMGGGDVHAPAAHVALPPTFLNNTLALHDAPWFRPLRLGAPVEQLQALPPLLKVLACSRKAAPVPSLAEIVPLLAGAVFRVPCGSLTSCEDPQQKYRARTIMELSRRAAALDGALVAAGNGDMPPAAVAAAAAAAGGGELADADAAPPSTGRKGSVGRLQMEMHRCAVLLAQAVGVAFNRAPAAGSHKAAFDAWLVALLRLVVAHSGVGASTLGLAAASAVAPAPAAGEAIALEPPAFVHAGAATHVVHRARERGVLLLVWLTKGLAMRSHSAAQVCAAALVNVVTGRDVAHSGEVPVHHRLITLAGQGLGVVLADSAPHHPFHRLAGTTVLSLYKQKLFAFVFSTFVALQAAARAAAATAAATGPPTPSTEGSDLPTPTPALLPAAGDLSSGSGSGSAAGGGVDGASAARHTPAAATSTPAPPPASPPLVPLLLSLCAMATHLPQSVLLSEIDKVLPIVVRALEIIRPPFSPVAAVLGAAPPVITPVPTPSPAAGGEAAVDASAASSPAFAELRDAVAISALFCLRMLVEHAAPAVAPHLHSLVPVLLALSRFFPSRPSKPLVRATAVDCLRGLTVLPYHKLHPLKAQLLAGLVPALDDPKRAVRRRAAACRNDWTTLAPGNAPAGGIGSGGGGGGGGGGVR